MINIGPVVFLVLILLAIGINILVTNIERQKIRKSAGEKGWTILNIALIWFPLKWGASIRVQYFDVKYKDAEGHENKRTCKTSIFGGVDWNA